MTVRRFASETEARRYALEKGAAITGPAGRFNANRERLAIAPPASPAKTAAEPTPEVRPVPPPLPGGDGAALAVDRQTVTFSRLFNELKDTIREAAALGARPPDEWVFDIERDDKGRMTKITAKAVRPRLN